MQSSRLIIWRDLMHFIRSLFRLQTLNPHLKMDRCKIKTHRCKANTPLTGISPGFPLKLLFPMQLTVSSWDIAFLCLQDGTNQPPSPCNFEIKYRTPKILLNSKMIKSSIKNPFMSKPSRHHVESSTIFLVKTIKCWTFLVIYGIVTSLKTHQNHRLSCSFLPQHSSIGS